MNRPFLPPFLALLAILLSVPLTAQEAPRIDQPSLLDRRYMDQQRELIDELGRSLYGQGLRNRRDDDLALMQRLLDEGRVRPGQTRELQAMGVVMGDLLATELDMQWVVYEDRSGRSRALRYQGSDNYLFPITMISRRWEAGSRTPVAEIYQTAVSHIEPVRNPLPFQ